MQVRESVFLRRARAFLDRLSHNQFPEMWMKYLYDDTRYIVNLQLLQNLKVSTCCLFMGMFLFSSCIGVTITAIGLQIIDKLLVNEEISANENAKRYIQAVYNWSGLFSLVICFNISALSGYYLTSFINNKDISSDAYTDLSCFIIEKLDYVSDYITHKIIRKVVSTAIISLCRSHTFSNCQYRLRYQYLVVNQHVIT